MMLEEKEYARLPIHMVDYTKRGDDNKPSTYEMPVHEKEEILKDIAKI